MGEIAPKEQFLSLSTIFYYLMLDFYVKTGIRFSLRDKRLFEITEVEITRVDCMSYFEVSATQASSPSSRKPEESILYLFILIRQPVKRLIFNSIQLLSLKTHFSAYMRRVTFIITSNKHTLSLFLTSKDSLI